MQTQIISLLFVNVYSKLFTVNILGQFDLLDEMFEKIPAEVDFFSKNKTKLFRGFVIFFRMLIVDTIHNIFPGKCASDDLQTFIFGHRFEIILNYLYVFIF